MATTAEKKDKFQFYMSDICPYAQRTWIALLEKEEKPSAPVLFDMHMVNAYNKTTTSITWPEFLSINPAGTVPSATHNGQNLRESLVLNEYVNDAFPGKPLLPPTPEGRFRARWFIKSNEGLTDRIFPLIMAAPEAKAAEVEKTLAAIRNFSASIVGPYAVGEQFTLADIAYISIFESLFLTVKHYTGFAIPTTAEYANVHAWWALVSARESVRIAQADRTDRSMAVYPFESKTRAAYLQELGEPLKYGLPMFLWARSVWAKAAPGKRAITQEELQKRAKEAASIPPTS